jgi:hypothetical protein
MANENKRLKMAVIVGASQALRMRAESNLSDEEVIRQVNREIESIVSKIDSEN